MCEDCKVGGPVDPNRMQQILKEEGVTEEWMAKEHEAIIDEVKSLYPEGFEWGPRDKIRGIKAIRALPNTPEGIAIKRAWVALYKFELMAIKARMSAQMFGAAGSLADLFKGLGQGQPIDTSGTSNPIGKILGFGRPQIEGDVEEDEDDYNNILKNFKTGTDN